MSVSTVETPTLLRPAVAAEPMIVESFDRLACGDCESTFRAPEGAALLYGLKAPCPHCGGEFRLVPGLT